MDVWRIGDPTHPAVVLLHELPGLYDVDLALARCLSREGLSIYTPRIFGRFGGRDDAGV